MRSSDLAPWLAPLVLAGCFGPIDHEGRRCPCAAGYVCDTVLDRCSRAGADASLDAATEARDASSHDAPALDAVAAGEDARIVVLDARAEVVDASATDASMGRLDAPASPADAHALDAWAADAQAFDAWALDARGQDAWTADAASAFVHCPAGARLCDDFESAEADRVPPWSYSDGLDSRSTERAARGLASGRFSGVPPAGEQSVGLDLSTDPREMWARFWLLIRPRTLPADTRDGAVFHVGDDTAPRYDNISVVLNDGGIGTYNSAAGMYRAGPSIPDDTWTCVALHVVVGDPGTVELYVGSTRAFTGSERTTFAGGTIRVMDAGLTYLDPASDRITVHLDDVAIRLDGTPMLCP